MIPDNVTLIVKAPNQQIEDQNIECQSSWTVRQLKGHLSEVYPSKPSTEEQKIIYSGQLLDDGVVLRDVLRTYESQIAHTMHLVCAPSKNPVQIPSTDGLRQRTVPSPASPEPNRPETRQNDQNHTMEMQNYLSSVVSNYGRVPPYHGGAGSLPGQPDPALVANHMLMMHHAYLQYMQQYANMWQPRTEAPPPPPPPPAEEDRRDWLDQLYEASRLAVLLSLVYLYGSPARLLFVVLVAAAGYLHHIGFFRDLNLNPAPVANEPNRNPDNQANQANQPANQANQPDNQANQPVDHANQPDNLANQTEQPDNQNRVNEPENHVNQEVPAPATNNDNQQSLLAVTWMIFTSFFASLIPEAN